MTAFFEEQSNDYLENWICESIYRKGHVSITPSSLSPRWRWMSAHFDLEVMTTIS